jgi:hypothetical protein
MKAVSLLADNMFAPQEGLRFIVLDMSIWQAM